MYWTHLIFVLLQGALISWNKTSASKPGYLDFDNLPETNFSCDGKVIGGYYADVETGCQMFHVCTIGQKGEVTDIKFLCLNGTVFDQETRVCERIDEVDCSKSEDFFGLNLELYGNNANFGIQPENEFECDDCSTDQTDEDDEYEESEETTTYTTSTTTTTTTTTTPKPTTTSTTTARPYPSSNQDTIAALLALHNVFNQGSKVKPPPPRVINNAFSPTKPTIKPYSTYPTQRPNVNLNFKSHYTPDSQSYGSLNLQQRERPYYFTPSTEKSNYHHFHSGDTSFGHSFDATRPYNFQYFHSRKLPEEKASVSVVTSTSTSTSVKTSKGNSTEYPTGYDDYQDDIQDSYFDDISKVREKRELHPNHKYDDTNMTTIPTTVRYKNHKYDDEVTTKPTINDRDEFLQNLLGSIDLEDNVREKMTDFFKKEEEDMDRMKKKGGFSMDIGNKIGQVFLQGFNFTPSDGRKARAEKLLEWQNLFDDMKKDIKLNYTFETNINDNDNNTLSRVKRDARRTDNTRSTVVPPQIEEITNPRGTHIDTEKFRVEPRKRNQARQHSALIPVSESIQDDLTTVEYRKTSKKARSQPLSTISLRAIKFNYETTTALSEPEPKPSRISNARTISSKEVRDFVHENHDQSGIVRKTPHRIGIRKNKFEQRNPTSSKEETEFTSKESGQRQSIHHDREFISRDNDQQIQHRARGYASEESVKAQPVQHQYRELTSRELDQSRPIQHHSMEFTSAENIQVQPIQHQTREFSGRESVKTPLNQHNSREFASREHDLNEPIHVRSREQARTSHPPLLDQTSKEVINFEAGERDERVRPAHVRKRVKQIRTSHNPSTISRESSNFTPSSNGEGKTEQHLPQRGQLRSSSRQSSRENGPRIAENPVTVSEKIPDRRNRGKTKSRGEWREVPTTTSSTVIPRVTLTPDPDFSCEGKVKGGFYADLYNDCKAFFICSQGAINGPLLKTHFPCGDKTKFNQRSRTCQAEDQVECEVSHRYFHLNNDFLVPVSEDELKGSFEPMKER